MVKETENLSSKQEQQNHVRELLAEKTAGSQKQNEEELSNGMQNQRKHLNVFF